MAALKGFTYYGYRKMDEDEDMLDAASRNSCKRFVCIIAGLSGLQWQAFVPSLSLLVTQGLGQPVEAVGQLYAAFISASVVGFLALPLTVKREPPATIIELRPCTFLRRASPPPHQRVPCRISW